MHSLVTALWDEWLAFEVGGVEAASSETAGLVVGFRVAADVSKGDSEGTVCLATSRLWVMRRLIKLWKASRWGLRLNPAGCVRVPESMKGRVRLELPADLYDDIVRYPPSESTERDRYWHWLRGVWGNCGSIYVPKSGYYLVLRTSRAEIVPRMKRVLRFARISWGERTVRGSHELILRSQEEIVAFLSKIGLTGVSLLMEDKAILRAIRDQANRVRNCDTANIRKSLEVSERQMNLALRLRDDGLLPTLPARLKELVTVRIEHPEASLSELGNLLSPPITKSTVKYRWNRLRAFVGEVAEEK